MGALFRGSLPSAGMAHSATIPLSGRAAAGRGQRADSPILPIAVPLPLLNQRPFKLGLGADNLNISPAGGRGFVTATYRKSR
jgi:hypothetical protein